MLLKQLSEEDQRIFLCVAELLTLCDKPLLWGDKRREVETEDDKFANVHVDRDEREAAAMEELCAIHPGKGGGGLVSSMLGQGLGRADIERKLTNRLEKLSLQAENDPTERVKAANEVLREILKGKTAAMPSVPKLMLFELLMLALTNGSISGVQWQVLTGFKHHYQLEDFIFNDLLERAQATYEQTQKTIAIILE
ncbi:TPA: hypothetical protein SLZ45_001322 [Burkholderia multivorans]|jgi:hypothetical protein|nr:hypothetical protein [Burkholderia multivorans]